MFRVAVLLGLTLLLFSASVAARDYQAHGPIPARGQNPLHLLFLAPRPERAIVLPHRQLQLTARGAYSNLFERDTDATTGIGVALDMELFRPAFLLQYGFRPGWEIGFELPLLHFEGGFLDAFIQDFHDAFGLPNAGRDRVPNGRFSYAVQRNGAALYAVDTEPLGLADFILHLKKEFLSERHRVPAVAGTFYLKLPTGDSGEGLGSGAPDFGVNIAAEKHYRRLHGYLNFGGVVFGGRDLGLEAFLSEAMLHWMLALEVTAWEPHLAVLVQVQGDSGLFHGTGLDELDSGNLILTVGFAGREGPWGWKAAFAEDPSGSGPAVDFTTCFELSYTWDFAR